MSTHTEQSKQKSNKQLLDRYGNPCKVDAFYLTLSWSISRGRDTYGYNICRLDAPGYYVKGAYQQAERFKTMGGGYDMVGTVIGDWLESRYQDRLMLIHERSAHLYRIGHGFNGNEKRDMSNTLYGMTAHIDENGHPNKITLDGACGDSSMEAIAKAIGLRWSFTCNRKGHRTGLMVTDYGSEENARDMGRE